MIQMDFLKKDVKEEHRNRIADGVVEERVGPPALGAVSPRDRACEAVKLRGTVRT